MACSISSRMTFSARIRTVAGMTSSARITSGSYHLLQPAIAAQNGYGSGLPRSPGVSHPERLRADELREQLPDLAVGLEVQDFLPLEDPHSMTKQARMWKLARVAQVTNHL